MTTTSIAQATMSASSLRRAMTPPSFRKALCVIALVGPFALAAPAAAQDVAAAKALFDQARALMDQNKYETACPKLAESHRLDPRAGTLFTLAVCESRWGRTATAKARFDEYLRFYNRLPPDQQAQQSERQKAAKEARDRLAQEEPQITLLLPPGAPSGTVVKRNGEVIGQAAIGIALPVDPGEHLLTTQAPGGPVWEKRITIGKGDRQQITLEVKWTSPASQAQAVPPAAEDRTAPGATSESAAPVATPDAPLPTPAPAAPNAPAPGTKPPQTAAAPAPPAPTGDQAPGGRRVAVYVIGGVGLAGLVAGGVTGGLALGKKSVIEEHCGAGIGSADKAACDQTGLDAGQSVKTLGLVSTIGLVAGVAGVGTGAVLLLTAPKAAQPATGARPEWIRVGVLAAGPQGALVGLTGAW